MPETYAVTSDAITFIGLVGVISTVVIVYSVFRSYWSSPYLKKHFPSMKKTSRKQRKSSINFPSNTKSAGVLIKQK
jgi:hypothetical protein